MDPPVWTTERCPSLDDFTPLLKTLLQFGLHLPLPACPFRMWVATFTQRLSAFTRRQLFKRKRCRPHGPGRKRATPVHTHSTGNNTVQKSGLRPSTKLLLETAVSWLRHRLSRSTPKKCWEETREDYGRRLKRCCLNQGIGGGIRRGSLGDRVSVQGIVVYADVASSGKGPGIRRDHLPFI